VPSLRERRPRLPRRCCPAAAAPRTPPTPTRRHDASGARPSRTDRPEHATSSGLQPSVRGASRSSRKNAARSCRPVIPALR
jgi:hypothetical protein